MEQVKINALKKAIQTLEALGIQYAIIDHEGNLHGNLNVAEKKTKTREGYEWGSLSNYISPLIENIMVGDVRVMDAKDFDIESVRSTAVSILVKRFGNGSCRSAIDREKNTVEIFRVM